jgi:N-acetylmuramic acid 6-phosphate etherase
MQTESPSTCHPDLDRYAAPALVAALVDDQRDAVEAVSRAAGDLARAVDAAVPRLAAGGRLVYVGAGTSGRLGLLDAVELWPTFSWPPERAVPVLAGGPDAVRRAREGAEDDAGAAAEDLRAVGVGAADVVLVLAASGTTPYALAACDAAREAGALTIGLANNPGAPLLARAEIGVLLDTGPELVSGSTRLKAGTAQKVALNAFSTAAMVRLGKVYRNLMVDVRATNAKLRTRAVRLVVAATGRDEHAARAALEGCAWSVSTAIVAVRCRLDPAEAAARLAAAGGRVREAVGEGA